MTRTLTLALIAWGLQASAQTQVQQTSFTFSDGLHPSFMVAFDNGDDKDLEGFYKNRLKMVSKDVSNKKEIKALGARVPEIAADTITILCAVEQPRKSTTVNVHLAFRVNGAFLASTSEELLRQNATDYAYRTAVAYKTKVLQDKLGAEQKTLEQFRNDLATLKKEKDRTENTLEKTKDKGKDAAKDKLDAEHELSTTNIAIETKKTEVAGDPSEQNTKDLQDLLKDRSKLESKIEKYTEDSADAEKKGKDLEQDIKDNLKQQDEKQKAIADQETKVKAAQLLLDSVN
ncbi:MAG: hypothetical protein H6595_05530 [Flavobacteriales bacterium]|nr:hypothetical protein [Flavobacteriales bacterium]MCB9166925.1 hypothetical protein [Flavobacteriales bacterium]